MSRSLPSTDLLLPTPRRAVGPGSGLTLGSPVRIGFTGPLASGRLALGRIESGLRRRGLSVERGDAAADLGATVVRLGIERDPEIPPEGYRLDVSPAGIELLAGDAAGLFYAVLTLEQWLEICLGAGGGPGNEVAGLAVEDHPAFPNRAVLLDVSRNRVPRMDTLRRLVDLLAGWKINQIQLYTEHTFAYAGHETVWRDSSPLTAEEVRALDAYCRERFVELVPNQNTLGHFHRWLRHDPYRELAECPEGIDHPFSREREPYGLCAVDPASIELVADLLEQLLPHFSSQRFNGGLDEPLDLGRCRSAAAVTARGLPTVYLEYLERVREIAAGHGRRLQFWADVVLEHPELLERLPKDVTALAWGYEGDHPFAADAAQLAEAGVPFYLCPGTGSWNSFGGRARAALLNIAAAALAGAEAGARGILIADWGDNGHLQPLPVSYPAFAAGAAFAWNNESAREPLNMDLATLLDRYVFAAGNATEGGSLGRALMKLGNTYLDTAARPLNGTVFFRLLTEPQDDLDHRRYRKLEPAGLERALERVDSVRSLLAALRPATPEQQLVRRELVWVADALAAGARLGLARFAAGREVPITRLPAPVQRALTIDLDSLAHVLPELWLARSRPGGLRDSLAVLERARPARLHPGNPRERGAPN